MDQASKTHHEHVRRQNRRLLRRSQRVNHHLELQARGVRLWQALVKRIDNLPQERV